MEPFRDHHRSCPSCQTLLREHASWLVCDTCNGILLPISELARAIRELVPGTRPVVTVRGEEPGERPCPQCRRAMIQGWLDVTLDPNIVRPAITIDLCDVHGLWCDDGELARVFEAANERPSETPNKPGQPWWKRWS